MMILKKIINKLTINVVMGFTFGFLAALCIIAEGNILMPFLSANIGPFSIVYLKSGTFLLALAVFFLVFKKFLSMKTRKLTAYYFFAITISTIVVIIVSSILFQITGSIYVSGKLIPYIQSDLGKFIIIHLVVIYILLLLAAFSLTFTAFVNRKVRYIEYISSELEIIQKKGFGQTLELHGNDEITELCKRINSMSKALKIKDEKERQVEREKAELITNVSHDLRSPLTSIIGYVELLKQENSMDTAKYKEYISVVGRRLAGLNVLINELFEYAKLNSADFQLMLVKKDMIASLKHFLGEWEILLKRQGYQLEKDIRTDTCMIDFDPDKMFRALQNLFDNAQKYAKKGSLIKASAWITENILHMSIENELNGLQNLDSSEIFERFYKGDKSRTDTENSSGLGLSIVQRIIELHGGTIDSKICNNKIIFDIQLPMNCQT